MLNLQQSGGFYGDSISYSGTGIGAVINSALIANNGLPAIDLRRQPALPAAHAAQRAGITHILFSRIS